MKLNVAVFFGGESVEHEVSVISAHQAGVWHPKIIKYS